MKSKHRQEHHMQAMVTLTNEESLRLIAKSVAALHSVQQAKENGHIGFSLCSSAAFIIQELIGKDSVDPSKYCCGFIHSRGSCSVPPEHREKLLLLEKGTPHWLNFPDENITPYFDQMTESDIIIKSGNVLDPFGKAGVLVASPNGGEAGAYLPQIAARGIQLIVPMSISKTVPLSLEEILPHMGILKFASDRVHGMACGMLALPGKVVTELDALKTLFGVKAIPAAVGGVGSGVGTVTLVLTGEDHAVESAWEMINHIKGEKKLSNYFSKCKDCLDGKLKSGSARCSTRLKGVTNG
jgi:hypothetical protein